MVHLFVVYDNQDKHLGDYFVASSEHLCRNVDIHCNIQTFDTIEIQAEKLPNAISGLNQEKDTPFLIANYTHGQEDALIIDNERFIHKDNAYLFGQSFFYACGCYAAKELKVYLMHYNCRFFMGYEDKISTPYNPEYDPIFYHCENALLARFLSTSETIEQCLDYMYEQYEEMKMEVDIATALVLESNLNSFVYDGDTQLTKNDFI